MRRFAVVVALLSLVALSSPRGDESVKDALSYLDDIEEVSWHVVDGNSVYIGISKRPSDLYLIASGAAVNGHKALGKGFHAYVLVTPPATKKNPSSMTGYLCSATARYGKVQKNNC